MSINYIDEGLTEDQKHLAGLLRKGVVPFDGYRRKYPNANIDLGDCAVDLRSLNLEKVNLGSAILVSADFSPRELPIAEMDGETGHWKSDYHWDRDNFKGVLTDYGKFTATDLSLAHLARANMKYADLRKAKLDKANATDVVLEEANLEGASLQGALLVKANMKYARCAMTDMSGATLRDVSFKSADVRGTNFSGANLCGVDFSEIQYDAATSFVGAQTDLAGYKTMSEEVQQKYRAENPKMGKALADQLAGKANHLEKATNTSAGTKVAIYEKSKGVSAGDNGVTF